MLGLNSVITTKNLEYYMQHQEEEAIEMLREVMLNIKKESVNHILNEENFKLLKPKTMEVSFSFVKSTLGKFGYRVGHRIDQCIARSEALGSVHTGNDDTKACKRIDIDKMQQFQGEQKMLSLRVSASVKDRWDQMAKSNVGIQKGYLLSYILDDILSQFGY
jgi:hypothetical protein